MLIILEYVFSEIYQSNPSDNSIHSQEDKQLIADKGLQALRDQTLTFIHINSSLLSQDTYVFNLSDYVKFESNFDHGLLRQPTLEVINQAGMLRFLGNLTAKIDFAVFYAEIQGQ